MYIYLFVSIRITKRERKKKSIKSHSERGVNKIQRMIAEKRGHEMLLLLLVAILREAQVCDDADTSYRIRIK